MFFTAINQMMTEGVDLTLVIRKANGQLTVSLLPKSNGLKDEAQNHLVPLTVSGLPQELDAGFLQAVARPIQKTTGLISNMAQFEAQAEKAASESKAAKETKAKETKEAVTALGQARLYAKPQDQKKIDEMVAEQTKAMNKGSLFELMDEPAPQPQQPQAQPAAAPQQPRQAPQYPPQPQAQRPMATQAPGGQQRPAASPQQQQAMWPPQQPPQGPGQYYQPQSQPYMGQQPVPQQAPQLAHGGYHGTHWQEPVQHPEELSPHYHAGEDEPNYRPEDYEEYPDFPQSMLENHVSQYQAV